MSDLKTFVNQKSLDWLDKIVHKKNFNSRGEALDYLINQQLKRRGNSWLAGRRTMESKSKSTMRQSRISLEATTTRKRTAGQIRQSKNTTLETEKEKKLRRNQCRKFGKNIEKKSQQEEKKNNNPELQQQSELQLQEIQEDKSTSGIELPVGLEESQKQSEEQSIESSDGVIETNNAVVL